MNKIKEFLSKIFSPLRKGLKNIVNRLDRLWDKFKNIKIIKKIRSILSFIPNMLSEKYSYRKRQALWGIVFILPLAIGFIYFFLIPFLITFIYSFSRVENLGANSSTGIHIGIVTEWIGFDNFKYILNEHATFKDTLGNAFFNTGLNVILILVFSLIIAVLLNSKFKGRAFVRAVFFMPVIFNSQAVDAAMATGAALSTAMETATNSVFVQSFNLMDFLIEANIPAWAVNFLGAATTQIYNIISYSGVQILIFLAGIQSVPKHLYEAAKIEGATQYEIFWKITFPMVSPLMLTAGVYTVVDSYLRSELLKTINVFKTAGTRNIVDGLGALSYYGIHASMSWLFALSSIIIIAIILFGLSKLVFYYDE